MTPHEGTIAFGGLTTGNTKAQASKADTFAGTVKPG